jgi:hypothetical protein
MDSNESDSSEHKKGEAEEPEEKDRKYPRRSLKDRRRIWIDHNYKGPQRRYHFRRLKNDRREEDKTEDDLKNHFLKS